MNNVKRILAIAIATLVGLIPTGAFAETGTVHDDTTGVAVVQNENVASSVNINAVIETAPITATTSSAVVVENPGTDDAVIQQPAIVNFDDEYSKANEVLGGFKATNDTTAEDVINSIKNNIDSSINVSFTEDGTFTKNNATTDAPGVITGTIKLKDDIDNKEIQVNLVIEQLKPAVDIVDLNSEIDKGKLALMIYKATNDTKEQDIVDLVKGSISSNIIVSIKDFKITPATADTYGNITGVLNFNLDGETQEFNVFKMIDKLELQNDVVARLDVKMNGLEQDNQLLFIGNKAFVEVTGYDAAEKQVELNQTLIQYQWYVDGKAISDGINSEIKITKDMKGKNITCTVNYDDKGGTN